MPQSSKAENMLRPAGVLKATIITGDRRYWEDRLFSATDSVNKNDELANYRALREELCRLGILLSTEDIHPPEESSIVFQWNATQRKWFGLLETAYRKRSGQIACLLLLEPPGICAANGQNEKHQPYDAIFTFMEDQADGDRYILFRWAWDLTPEFGPLSFNERKFCATIAGFKRVRHSLQLYSERQRAIRWFAAHHPDEFDLYGTGWPAVLRDPIPSARAERALANILKYVWDPLFPPNLTYRGPIAAKRRVLQQYKFALAYENMRDIPGYIGDKIWDCLCAGCIPVYRGAQNVADLIPREIFIDLRDFPTYDELYRYLAEMPEEDFNGRREIILEFLHSERAAQFSVQSFARTISAWIAAALPRLSGSHSEEQTLESSTVKLP